MGSSPITAYLPAIRSNSKNNARSSVNFLDNQNYRFSFEISNSNSRGFPPARFIRACPVRMESPVPHPEDGKA